MRMKEEDRAGKSSLHFCDHRAAASRLAAEGVSTFLEEAHGQQGLH